LYIEYFEDMHERRGELLEQLKQADDIQVKSRLSELLARIEKALGQDEPEEGTPFVTGDPLVDKWEQELMEGRMPDLEEGLPENG
jgi:hypothetical protein